MNDQDLVAAAIGRLHESAQRLEALVEQTQSPALKVWLGSLARRLGEHAERASAIRAMADANPQEEGRAAVAPLDTARRRSGASARPELATPIDRAAKVAAR